jgi:hypothetical protein
LRAVAHLNARRQRRQIQEIPPEQRHVLDLVIRHHRVKRLAGGVDSDRIRRHGDRPGG